MADMKSAAPPEARRPLSPHLQIYRWSWTMAMSIFHRVTGVALYGGTLLLAAFLLVLASGKTSFDTAQMIASSIPGRLVLFGYTWALLHHMLGGLRHFVWDFGKGYDPSVRMNLARFTLVGSLVLTLGVWALVYVYR
jgi:succinate dehydrogenase / fumarate reductase, cytochrome b subunit